MSIGMNPFLRFPLKFYLFKSGNIILIKLALMSDEYVVRFCQIPEFKLRIQAKKYVWYRRPITENSRIALNFFNTHLQLRVSSNDKSIPNTAQYHLPSNQFLQQFYSNPIMIDVLDGNRSAGFCRIEPSTLIQKPIIVPILSYEKFQGREVKLGDLEIQFKVERSKVPVEELYEIKQYLDSIKDNPTEFRKLYDKLKREKLF